MQNPQDAIRLVDRFRYRENLEIEKYVLPNGLTVLYWPDFSAPLFSFQSWFRVGSRHEVKGRTGIAHLFEHLMFKGTKNHPEGDFDRILESFGGRNNAATWLDWTYFYDDVPSGFLNEVMALEADRLVNMRLCPEEVEPERQVVMNERRERVDNDPSGRLSELLWQKALEDHPYAHPTIGWMEDIAAISLENCVDFHRTWYSPNQLVLSIAGAVTREELFDGLLKYYAPIPASKPGSAPELQQTPPAKSVTVEERFPLTCERLLLGYSAPSVTDPLYPALEVLNELLFEGDSARLQRALCTDGEIASEISAYVPAFKAGGLYEICSELRPDHQAEEALDVLFKAFEQICREKPAQSELDKAKNKLETRFYRGLQTMQQRAQGLGFYEVTAGDYHRLFELAKSYSEVTPDDLQAVAQRVFNPNARTIVIGRPSGEPACEEEEA